MALFGLVRGAKAPEKPSISAHYVGDSTLLIHGEEDVFIYVDGRDVSLTPCLLRDGTWEPQIGRFLDSVLQPGDCFVDIGANVGVHALHAARKVGPTGLIIAFEPQQRMHDLLDRSICANVMQNYVLLQKVAIGAASMEAQLGTFDHYFGSATLTDNALITGGQTVTVHPLDTALDHIAQPLGRAVLPRAVKIDVEGFEWEVWQGMRDWTRQIDSLDIIIEFSPVSYRNRGHDPRGLLNEFMQFGFAIAALQSDGTTVPCADAELDAIAASERQYDLVLTKQPAPTHP